MEHAEDHHLPLPPPNEVGGSGVNANKFAATSLYVGDLDLNLMEWELYDHFTKVGHVASVKVCRDRESRRSLGYGYINYGNSDDAALALERLNFSVMHGKPIRIMYSHRDPTLRKTGAGNLFIKNLDKAIDNKALHDTFLAFGNILSCKIATDPLGRSKGYGFVQFENEETAKNAIDNVNGTLMNGKQVFVGPFLRKHERVDIPKFSNIYVKNLSISTTDEDLRKTFGEYGTVTSAVVMRDENGKSKGFGFVNFEDPDDAAKSVEALNGKKFDDMEWYVGKAQKKPERELELSGLYGQSVKESPKNSEGLNLYFKNFDDNLTEDQLKDLFSVFGRTTSCKIMREPNGMSKGSGFIAFSTAEEASRALSEMNGKMVAGKPLYVALASRKEERKARLDAQISHSPPAMMAPMVPPQLMYSPVTTGPGPQFFYGHSPPAMLSHQYTQQLAPGLRLNFPMPIVQPGQETYKQVGQHSGVGKLQHPLLPPSLIRPQMLPRGHVHRYTPGNMSEVPLSRGARLPVSHSMAGGFPSRATKTSQPMDTKQLASALANASPEQQKALLAEILYPSVDLLEHESAAKVTSMLLEMDQTEVLHLLESPKALKSKVGEAMEILRNLAPPPQQLVDGPVNRLSALSLRD